MDMIAPLKAAMARYSVNAAHQGAFHPSGIGVTDPVTSRVTAGPTNSQALADQDASNPSANPAVAALHAAIARYYGG